MQRRTFMWSLTGVAAVLGFMLTVQITSKPQSSQTYSSYLDLRTQIDEQLQEHKTLLSDIAKQKAQILQFETSRGDARAMQDALLRDARTIASEAGLTKVSGNGITITIKDDAKLPFYKDFAGQFQSESDQEISQIVNDLFANGATAISINGERLVTTSSIRLVSGLGGFAVLQVNGNPITMPYVITAVGNVSQMQAVLTVNNIVPILNLMQEDCLVKPYNGKRTVTVDAYTGPLPGAFAKEVGQP